MGGLIPRGYISGMKVGAIISKRLRELNLVPWGDNYNTLFSWIRTQVPKVDNGVSGRGKKYYYRETDVIALVNTVTKGLPEIFDRRKDEKQN